MEATQSAAAPAAEAPGAHPQAELLAAWLRGDVGLQQRTVTASHPLGPQEGWRDRPPPRSAHGLSLQPEVEFRRKPVQVRYRRFAVPPTIMGDIARVAMIQEGRNVAPEVLERRHPGLFWIDTQWQTVEV